MEVKAYGNAWYVIGRCRDFCCALCPVGIKGRSRLNKCGIDIVPNTIVFKRKLEGVETVNGMHIGAKTK